MRTSLFVVFCLFTLFVVLKIIYDGQIRLMSNELEKISAVLFPENLVTSNNSVATLEENQVGSVPKNKLMFLKTHKCGTSSLVSILYLYGIRRNLNFVLTPYQHQFFNDLDVLKLRDGEEYDILCQHHRSSKGWDYYRPHIVHHLLARHETFYFTILRSPMDQFMSNFMFFKHDDKVKKKMKLNDDTSTDETVRKLLQSLPNNTITCNNIINPMSFDLGFSQFLQLHSESDPGDQITKFIEYLDREFDYVMIMDKFDESLVLLKQLLGWNIDDIAYIRRMSRSVRRRDISNKLSPKTIELLKYHNKVDVMIYGHFLQKFDTLLKKSIPPKELNSNLSNLKSLQTDLVETCLNTSIVSTSKLGTKFHPLSEKGGKVAKCRFMMLSDVFISKAISAKQDVHQISKQYFSALKLRNIALQTIKNLLNLFEEIRLQFLKNSIEF